MNGRRWFLALIGEVLVLVPIALLVADLVAHRRVERLGGVNRWGYRGPVMPQPQPTEIRIAVVGGDAAFGWGVAASETLAYGVRQLVALEIDKPGRPLRPVTAVNLGAAGLPLAGYADWIARYAALRPQVICIALDPIGHTNVARWQLPNRRSPIFRLTGYSPILPLVLEEKGALVGSRMLSSAGRVMAKFDRVDDRSAAEESSTIDRSRSGERVAGDRAALESAIRTALSIARAVVVIAPPYIGHDLTADIALFSSTAARFDGDRRVRFVALGDDPSMYDDNVMLDGFHFSAGGHATAAALVAPVVLEAIAS